MARAWLLFLLAGCGRGPSPEPAWGLRIVLKISPADAEPARLRRAERILEERLALLGFPHGRASAGLGLMDVRVPGAAPDDLHRVGGACGSGDLKIFEPADAAAHAAFAAGGGVPAEYQAFANAEPDRRAGPPWDRDRVLLRREPVLRGSAIREAWVEGGAAAFRLAKEARNPFRAAARRGPLALVLDGRVARVARFEGPIGNEDARIPCVDAEDARQTALWLMSDSLGVELGLGRYGSCSPRQAESVEFYGVPPAR